MQDKWFNECISPEDVALYTNQDYADFKGGVCSNDIGKYPDIIGGPYGNAGVVNFKISQKKSVSISHLVRHARRISWTSHGYGGSRESWRYKMWSSDPEVHRKTPATIPEKCATLLGKSHSFGERQQKAKEIRAAGGSDETIQEALYITALQKEGRYKKKEVETKKVETKKVERIVMEKQHHKPRYSDYHVQDNALSRCGQRRLSSRRSSRRSSVRDSVILQSLDLSGHLPADLCSSCSYDPISFGSYNSDSEAVCRRSRPTRSPPESPRHARRRHSSSSPPESPRRLKQRQGVGISPPASPKRTSLKWTPSSPRDLKTPTNNKRGKSPRKHRKDDHVSSEASTLASARRLVHSFTMEGQFHDGVDPEESQRLRAERLRGLMI